MAILTRRKTAAAALVVVGIAGLSIASAAQLDLAPDTLGAGSKAVTSCQPSGSGDNPIKVSFDSKYDSTTKGYMTQNVTLSDIDPACVGLLYKVTVDNGETPGTLEESTTSDLVASPETTVTLDKAVPAAEVENIAVVIFGAPDTP